MKKKIFSLFVALVATVAVQAQQISVVSPSGATTLYRTLGEAINGADPGSVVYLPGGGFTIADDVKITKKLTIIGIGHKSNGDNADGSTIISGNLWFNEGSSGSAVLGCYITGNVNIGEGDAEVNNVLVKYCNLNSVQVKNGNCMETFVNQNYIRSTSQFGESNPKIKNNILHSLGGINNGEISYNIILSEWCTWGGNAYSWPTYTAISANISKISNNIIMQYAREIGRTYRRAIEGSNNQIVSNMNLASFGEDCIIPDDSDWNNLFKNWNNGAISTNSDFHFKDEYKQYESQVGIYAGSGFNDKQMAPVPYITFKDVDEETDAAGKLKVRIRVKASE